MWLTRFALNRPVIVAMVFIAFAIFGMIAFSRLGRSLNPDVAFPVVVVQAGYPGASPAEMEKLIVKPIEDQLDGIDHLDQMTATAQEGVASVVVQFKIGTDLNLAAIDVQRRVDTARVFMPNDLDPPFVFKNGADSPMLTIAASSASMNGPALADVINNQIIPEIKRIPNVQSVDLSGAATREFEVEPNQNSLFATGATLSDLYNALQANNANLPGGRIDSATTETSVSVHADIQQASDILGIPLPIPGGANKNLRLGDVANAYDGHADQRSLSKFNGSPSVILDVNRTVNSDEINATKIARDKLVGIEKAYPQIKFTEIDAPADYTHKALVGVWQSLGEGIILTAIVLMLFLHAWRNAAVVMIAIPSSILATFIVMNFLNFRLDIMSLMGLSLIIGILVDDSIVVLENITRHRDMGEEPQTAAINGRSEIGGAAIAITLVDVVVFLPIAFLSGIVGQFLKEFAAVVVVATLFSLFVSFTLTPLLAAKWSVLKRSKAPPIYTAWFQRGYEALTSWYKNRALPYALTHRLLTALVCAGLLIGALSLPVLGIVATEFVPSTKTGDITMTVTYPPGTPIGTTSASVDRLGDQILKVSGIKTVLSTVGSKPSGWGSSVGGNYARLHAVTYPNRRNDQDTIIEQIRKLGWAVPGGQLQVSANGGGGSGGDPIFYTIAGPDSQINAAATKLAAFIRTIPGTVNVQTGAEGEAPRINVQIDSSRASIVGVAPGAAAAAARIAIDGAVATKVRTDNGLIDVRLQFPKVDRSNLDHLKNVRIRAGDGTLVPLSAVATFSATTAPTKIERFDRQTVVRVTGDILPGYALGSVTGPIDKKVNSPGFFPAGVTTQAQGDTQFLAETMTSMAIALLTSAMLVYMLMVVLYGSFVEPLIVMFAVPVAIVGAMVALAVSHQTLNLFSMIGIVMLFGLVSKNGILLVDYSNTLVKRGMRVHEAVVAAAATRFRPILMTTLAMVLGMLPLSLGFAEGGEFRRSMGTVIIGGLLSSLILTLFLVPMVYNTWMGWFERRADKRALRAELREPVAAG
ncbi:MAG: efflux RND transporter permease subunit [Candidatus Eremiobacteraeota bacterium]|nr:efflux RND transporter permease subunit [Candidatus Eremiobacteraeota bacterium]